MANFYKNASLVCLLVTCLMFLSHILLLCAQSVVDDKSKITFINKILLINPLSDELFATKGKSYQSLYFMSNNKTYLKQAFLNFKMASLLNPGRFEHHLMMVDIVNQLYQLPNFTHSLFFNLAQYFKSNTLLQKIASHHGLRHWNILSPESKIELIQIINRVVPKLNYIDKREIILLLLNNLEHFEPLWNIFLNTKNNSMIHYISFLPYSHFEVPYVKIRFLRQLLLYEFLRLLNPDFDTQKVEEYKKQYPLQFGKKIGKKSLNGILYNGNSHIKNGVMQGNGVIYMPLAIPRRNSVIHFSARSQNCNGVGGYIIFSINQNIFWEGYIDNEIFMDYQFPVFLKPDNYVFEMHYVNDVVDRGGDRNLLLEYVEVG